MTPSTIIYPELVDALGQPVDPARDEDAIEAHLIGQNATYSTSGLPPLGWNHGKPDGSRMVGWTVHRKGGTQIVQQHAFSINPQAITRIESPRNQLFATQAEFYVDDFGPGPATIQISQLIAHGRASAQAGGALARATAREDVLRFYDQIYVKVTANPGQYDLYFHDNHLWNQITSRTPERVYFPSQALQIVRNVQLHNVWQMQLTMITLDAPPNAATGTTTVPKQPHIRTYVVRRGDTLPKIATRLAGRKPTHKRVLQLQHQIIALTRKYGRDDITKNRTVPTYSPGSPNLVTGTIHVTRMHVKPGEKIILPTG